MDEETLSTCIMLVPDATYRRARAWVPEAHLTLGYFGRLTQNHPQVGRLLEGVKNMAASLGGPIEVVANATGIFPEGERYAVTDLIDGIGTFYARDMLETMFGKRAKLFSTENHPVIDYTHGFTPHITRDYVGPEGLERAMVQPREPLPFTFDAIGVWHGPYHWDVQL